MHTLTCKFDRKLFTILTIINVGFVIILTTYDCYKQFLWSCPFFEVI